MGRIRPFLLDLAPGGVCRASDVTAAAGGLLHRRFTLAGQVPARQYASLLHFPSGYPARLLAGTVLYGVRTFLSPIFIRPRSPDQLVVVMLPLYYSASR